MPTLIIDRRFGHLGRIKLHSGTTDPDVFARLNDRLTLIYNGGDFESLRAIKNREVTPLTKLLSPTFQWRRRTKKRQCYVYAALRPDTAEVKIGYAENVTRRFIGLQCGSATLLSLVAVIPGGQEVEEEIHARFAVHRIRGEWFRYAPEIEEWARAQPKLRKKAAKGPKYAQQRASTVRP